MTTYRTGEAIVKVAKALRRLADEHGRPNTFSCAEVAACTDLGAMAVGRIGRSDWAVQAVWRCLGGRAGWGSCPVYAEKRWAI